MSATLTPRQNRFVEEYLIDLNATQAAIRAGYSRNTAESQAVRLLGYVKVQASVREAQEAKRYSSGINAERVLRELGLLGFSNMQDYMCIGDDGQPRLDWKNLTRDQAAALSEVTVDTYWDGAGDDAREVRRVKFKLHDKGTNLERIGKHIGMFVDRQVSMVVTADVGDLELAQRIAYLLMAGTPSPPLLQSPPESGNTSDT